MNEAQPQTVVAATGQVATDIVGGLKGQPMLLAIVVLNCLGISAALYFLNKILAQGHERYSQLVDYCLKANGQ